MDEEKVYGKEKKYFNLGQMILIAVLCAVLGGALVFGAIRLFSNDNSNELTNRGDIIYDYPDKDLVPAIAEKLIPSVVGVRVTVSVDNIFMEQRQRAGVANGVIISEDGLSLRTIMS